MFSTIIETNRLKIKYYCETDSKRVCEIFNNKLILKYMVNIPSPYTEEVFMDWYNNDAGYNYKVVLKDSNILIGGIGISRNNQNKTGILGYWIDKDYWNQGYSTEAAKAILEYAFDNLDYNKISARVVLGNIASTKVLYKIGMRYVGILEKEIINLNNEVLDVELFEVVNKKWS